VTSVPDITRMLARIEDWKGQGPAMGRAGAACRLEEAQKLLEEVSNMLTDVTPEQQLRRVTGTSTRLRSLDQAYAVGERHWCLPRQFRL
jgi:hypothetical protein